MKYAAVVITTSAQRQKILQYRKHQVSQMIQDLKYWAGQSNILVWSIKQKEVQEMLMRHSQRYFGKLVVFYASSIKFNADTYSRP